VPVTLTVEEPPPPVLAVTPAALTFSATSGGPNPPAQSIAIRNTGAGALTWTASDDQPWLSVAPASGSAPADPVVSVATAGLAAGTYTGTITVTSPGAGGSPRTVGVTLTVAPAAGPGLVAAYGFEETAGTTVTDASGSGNTGTIREATRITTGRLGRALNFDGVNDWVTVPSAPSLVLTDALTLEAWIYPTQVGSVWRTVALKEQNGDLAYALYASTNTNRPSAHVWINGDVDVRGTAAVAANTWTHLAATYDGATLRLYVNGAQVASRAVAGRIAAITLPLRLGGNNVWTEWFRGRIDEVRVYNRALSTPEIQGDMTRPVTPG
jgi:hypothetical protein